MQMVKEQSNKVARYKFSEVSFLWLIEHLAQSTTHQLCGCQVPILMTAFFKPTYHYSKVIPLKDKGCSRINVYKCNYDEDTHDKGCLELTRHNISPGDIKLYLKT